MKKPLTAESAETAEKKTVRSFGVLGVLGGKTAHFFHTLSRACLVDLVSGLGVVAGSEACVSAGSTPRLAVSEIDLTAELEQAPTHNLVRGQPLGTIPGVLGQNRRAVERVVDIEIPAQPGLAEVENPGDADVELLEPIFVERLIWDQVDVDVGVTRRGAPARPDVASEGRRDLRIGSRVARQDRDPGDVLVRRAGLEPQWQWVDDQEFDLRSSGPRRADVAVSR